MGFRRKKAVIVERRKFTRRVMRARILCKNFLRRFPATMLVFVDESHFTRNDISRRYGYALPGKQVESKSHNLSSQSYSVIGAISYSRLLHYEIYDCSDHGLTHREFNHFINNLASKLNSNYIIIMDNARTHKFSDVESILEQHNISYIRLSPYSPDFSPIELLWNTVKTKLKMFWNSTRSLDQLIEQAMLDCTEDDFNNFYHHCMHIWNSSED